MIERAGEKRLAEIGQTADTLLEIGDDEAAGSDLKSTLEKMAEKHAGKETGGLALYYLADLLTKEGEYDRAAEIYSRIGAEYGDNIGLTAISELAQAYVYQRSGDNEKAMESFEKLLGRQDYAVPETQIRLEMGRMLETKGDLAAAAEMYRKVVEIDPEGDWSERAKARLSIIEPGKSPS